MTTTRTAHTSTANRRPIIWVVAALAVALLGTVAIALTRSNDRDDSDRADVAQLSETQPVAIDGTALPLLGDIDGSIGEAAPQASGSSFDGSSVELLTDDTPTVIGFFAHWCPHCQREVAELSEHFQSDGMPDGVRVVAVSTGVQPDEANFPPSTWFDDADWPTDVLVDDADSSLAGAYGLSAFPFWAVVDADGNIVGRLSGGAGSAQFDALVDAARSDGST